MQPPHQQPTDHNKLIDHKKSTDHALSGEEIMTAFVPGMLPEEYEDLRQGVAKFADEEVAPVSAELDAKHEFPTTW